MLEQTTLVTLATADLPRTARSEEDSADLFPSPSISRDVLDTRYVLDPGHPRHLAR